MKKHQLYEIVSNRLPGSVDDFVTGMNAFRKKDLRILVDGKWHFWSGEKAKVYRHAVDQECHAITAYACIQNPDWKYVFGFAALDSCCGTEWHSHSFCLDAKGRIVEATPLLRAQYCGVVLEGKIREKAIAEEMENIRNLGLKL